MSAKIHSLGIVGRKAGPRPVFPASLLAQQNRCIFDLGSGLVACCAALRVRRDAARAPGRAVPADQTASREKGTAPCLIVKPQPPPSRRAAGGS